MKDDLKQVTKQQQLDELRRSVRKDPKRVVSKTHKRWAEKYVGKRLEYDALNTAIDLLLKQRSLLASELTHMRETMTSGQQQALLEELRSQRLADPAMTHQPREQR